MTHMYYKSAMMQMRSIGEIGIATIKGGSACQRLVCHRDVQHEENAGFEEEWSS